jgi:hypothetical protein
MISHEMMAPLMFAGLVIFMLIGYPVSFSLAAVGLSFGFIAIQEGFFDFSLMQALPERVFGILANDTLLAIPFFTLMGSSAAGLRRICSTGSASSSARCAAASATRLSSSARSSAPSPEQLPRR